MHTKNKSYERFNLYKTKIKLQKEFFIKNLLSKKGEKYYDIDFSKYMRILHEITIPHTL